MANTSDILSPLDEKGVVDLSPEAWADVREAFEEVERHPTGMCGDLVILRGPGGRWIALEEPNRGTRVLRRLEDEGAVRRFVERRLAQYDRMWDGCGCKIDYHESASESQPEQDPADQ